MKIREVSEQQINAALSSVDANMEKLNTKFFPVGVLFFSTKTVTDGNQTEEIKKEDTDPSKFIGGKWKEFSFPNFDGYCWQRVK